MYATYLTSDDDKFLDVITDELAKYNLSKDASFILLFPPLSSRHRLLIHRVRDNNYPSLFSFSVGDEKASRRIIICSKSRMMDENNSTTTSTTTTTTTTSMNSDNSTKRRPDQAFYKPPRRSKNTEVPDLVSTSPPLATPPEEVQATNNSTVKVTKTKTARPSAEPYVPPSRRSQPVNTEMSSSIPTASSPPLTSESRRDAEVPATKNDNDDEKKEHNKEHEKSEGEEEEEEEEEWEKLLNADESFFQNGLIEEIQAKFKEQVRIKKPVNDYSQWTVDEIQIKETDLAHVVEVSCFPPSYRTEDIFNALKVLTRSLFDVKWVDETHALIVFPDANTALDVLQLTHPTLKICSMSQASSASKKKAKTSFESLQPYKARPQTSSLTANRRICAALGLKNPMSSDKTKTERQKIETARQQKHRDKEEQNLVWNGGVLPAASTTEL